MRIAAWAAVCVASPLLAEDPRASQAAAVARQLASVQQQRAAVPSPAAPVSSRFFLTAWSSTPGAEPRPLAAAWTLPQPPDPACDPLPASEIAPVIDAASLRNGLEPALVRAVIEKESGNAPCAVSPKGAQGLMQLMPETAAALGVADPFDPAQNVDAGTRFLRYLLGRYNGDVGLALAAYNAGPARVDAAGGLPDIPETQDYVGGILGQLKPSAPAPR